MTILLIVVVQSPIHDSMGFRRGPTLDPHANGRETGALNNCRDLFELPSGDFAVIGIDIPEAARSKLPATAGCAADERIALVLRKLTVEASQDIPATA